MPDEVFSTMLAMRIRATTPSEIAMRMWNRIDEHHLGTDKEQISAASYLSSTKRSAKSASRKYTARSPMMAKMLEVSTIKGSRYGEDGWYAVHREDDR